MTEKGPNTAALWKLIKVLPASKLVAVERFLAYLQNEEFFPERETEGQQRGADQPDGP
jgi:hypothetical protein